MTWVVGLEQGMRGGLVAGTDGAYTALLQPAGPGQQQNIVLKWLGCSCAPVQLLCSQQPLAHRQRPTRTHTHPPVLLLLKGLAEQNIVAERQVLHPWRLRHVCNAAVGARRGRAGGAQHLTSAAVFHCA